MPHMWIFLIVMITAGILALVLSHFERSRLTVNYYQVASKKLNNAWNGYRIAVLADLHDKEFGENNQKLIDKIKQLQPDCILIAGDLMIIKEWKQRDFRVIENLLKELSKIAPVYYGVGNHEARMWWEPDIYSGWREEFLNIMEKYDIHYLMDQTVTVTKGGMPVDISCLHVDKQYYVYKGRKRPMEQGYMEKKLGKFRDGHFHILLAHTPLYVDEYAEWGADLIFSGHFHGGTIRIPFLGGLMTPQMQFFTKLAKGEVKRKNSKMIVSAGLGTHSVNIRLNNPPEIVMVTLYSDEGEG